METVEVPVINGNVDAKLASWTENAKDDSPYAFILRVFLKRETVISETIGILSLSREKIIQSQIFHSDILYGLIW